MKKVLMLVLIWVALFSYGFATNSAPVLDVIGSKTITPNDTLIIHIYATDADNDSIILTATPLIAGSLTDSGTGGGVFNSMPTFSELGVYQVTVKATDSLGAIDSEVVTIVVEDTTIIMLYNIKEVGNVAGKEFIKVNLGLNGRSIVGSSVADTSPSIKIHDYNSFITAFRSSLIDGDTAAVRLYAQISLNNSSWMTIDSLVRAVNDTAYYLKSWTGIIGDYFRTITQALAGNDITKIYLEHSFKKEQ